MESRAVRVRYDASISGLVTDVEGQRYVLVPDHDFARVQALISASARVDAAYEALAAAFPDDVAFERIIRAG